MSSESLYSNCKTCGKLVAKSASACPSCGAKIKKLHVIHWIGIGFVALIIIGIVAAPSKPNTETTGTSTFTTADHNQSEAEAVLPAAEQQLVSIVRQYADSFRIAKNELQQSALRDERKQAIAQLLGIRRITEWRGKINQLETNTEGKAIFSVRISPEIDIKTWNNALSDMETKTLIEKSDPVYQSLFNLKVGDVVSFSGNFFPSDKDYIEETSLTINGSLTQPEFLFKFSSVTAVN